MYVFDCTIWGFHPLGKPAELTAQYLILNLCFNEDEASHSRDIQVRRKSILVSNTKIIFIYLSRTVSLTNKYIHQRDSPLVRLLGGEGMIPKSTQFVTIVTDTTQ